MALLQEEAESSRRRDPVRGEGSSNSRPLLKHSSAIPSRWDRTSDGGVDPVKPTFTPTTSSADSKVASLGAYRRAIGLCPFCADKWVKCHKCAPAIRFY